jgi:hypothetical protein
MRKTFEIPLDIPDVTIQSVETDRNGAFVITVQSAVAGGVVTCWGMVGAIPETMPQTSR